MVTHHDPLKVNSRKVGSAALVVEHMQIKWITAFAASMCL